MHQIGSPGTQIRQPRSALKIDTALAAGAIPFLVIRLGVLAIQETETHGDRFWVVVVGITFGDGYHEPEPVAPRQNTATGVDLLTRMCLYGADAACSHQTSCLFSIDQIVKYLLLNLSFRFYDGYSVK